MISSHYNNSGETHERNKTNLPHLQANVRKRPLRETNWSQQSFEARRREGWLFGNSSIGHDVGWAKSVKFECPHEAAYKYWAENAPLPKFTISSRRLFQGFEDHCTIRKIKSNFSLDQTDFRIDFNHNDGVVLLLPKMSEGLRELGNNIYHHMLWNADIWCTLLAGELLGKDGNFTEKIRLFRSESTEGGLTWAHDLLIASVGRPSLHFVDFGRRRGPDSREIYVRPGPNATSSNTHKHHVNAKYAIRVKSAEPRIPPSAEFWDSFAFQREQPALHIATLLGKHVRDAYEVPTRARGNGTVLLLLRSNTRQLFDLREHTSSKIFDALLAAGLPVEVACFDNSATLEEQVRILARAAVVISVHGAQLTNLAWMRPQSVVIEIVLRYGWCNDPYVFPPTPPCKPYHKSDFADMARAFNLTYVYYDAEYVGCRQPFSGSSNPISVRDVYVDSAKLAVAARNAYEDATQGTPIKKKSTSDKRH